MPSPPGRHDANLEAFTRMATADPVLVEVAPAIDVVPGLAPNVVLTSGAPLAWSEYVGGQRAAVVGGALYEGLGRDEDDVERKIRGGEIVVSGCHEYGCVGSVAGIFTASMPVFVVENADRGNRAFCNFYEGPSHKRLNYGVYDADVHAALDYIRDVIAPAIGDAVRALGGVPLRPLMRRAVHMGDELHSRNTAATLLFTRELVPAFLGASPALRQRTDDTLAFLAESDYFFLRISMAAAKATANAADGIEGSSVVTSMALSCRDFAIRVSGLGDDWFRGPHPELLGKLFDGYSMDDVEWMGGESMHAETVGFGGFAQAAAPALQSYQGGSPEGMVEMNRQMYQITVGEHPEYQIPSLGYRGTPLAIDIHKVVETGVVPVMDAGLPGKGGGQIGAGVLRAPLACFTEAVRAYDERYRRPQ
jgi:hypothetical protein